MALLFFDGFEAGDMSTKWFANQTNGLATSTATRFGIGRAVEIGFNSTNLSKNFPAAAVTTIGVAITGSRFGITFWGDSALTQHIRLGRNGSSGFLEVFRGGTLIAASNEIIPASGWTYIEAQISISATVGTVKVRFNGSTVNTIDFTGNTKNGGTNDSLDRVTLSGSTSSNFLYDDFYLLDNTGTRNNDFLGDVRVYTLPPNGNGSSSQLIGSDGNNTDNYLLVNGLPFTTANFVGSATPGQLDLYAMTDISPSVTDIFGLQNNIVALKSDATLASARPVLRINATNYNGTTAALTSNPTNYSVLYEQNPNTVSNWTNTAVNAVEAGMEVA